MANYASTNSLVQSVRRRTALINQTQTISDAEIKEFIKDASAQFYEILVSRWRDYYVKKTSLNLIANQEEYPLPGDFRAVNTVYLTYLNPTGASTPVQRQKLEQFNMNEYNNWGPSYFLSNPWPQSYRVMGSSNGQSTAIYFTPTSQTSATSAIELWYIPAYSQPATDDTAISTVWPNGWELWVTLQVCSDISVRLNRTEMYTLFNAERDRLEKRIIAAASIRDETAPVMVDINASFTGNTFRSPGQGS